MSLWAVRVVIWLVTAGVGAWGAYEFIHKPRIESLHRQIATLNVTHRFARQRAISTAKSTQRTVDNLVADLVIATRRADIPNDRACLTVNELRKLRLPAGSGGPGPNQDTKKPIDTAPAPARYAVSAQAAAAWIESCAARHEGLADVIRAAPHLFEIVE